MSRTAESTSWIFANGSKDPSPLLAYNQLLDRSQLLEKYPAFRRLFANYAFTNPDVFYHSQRTHAHFLDMTNALLDKKILTPIQHNKIQSQSLFIPAHDTGKDGVSEEGQLASKQIMEWKQTTQGITDALSKDPRPIKVLVNHASHVILGAHFVYIFGKRFALPKYLVDNFIVGILRHHQTDAQISSIRGIKKSYPEGELGPNPHVSPLTILFTQLADVFDAMAFPRPYIDKQAKPPDLSEIKAELGRIIPDQRLALNFPGHASSPAELRESILEAITVNHHAISAFAKLGTPDPFHLTWKGQKLIRESDKQSQLIENTFREVWDTRREHIRIAKEGLKNIYLH